MTRTHRLTAVALVIVLLITTIGATGIAAAAVGITSLDAPENAAPGDTVTVTATGASDEAKDTTVTISLFRMDTKEKLCEASGTSPTEVACSEQVMMPDDDLQLRTYIRFGGRIVEDEYATITATSTSDAGETDGDDSDESNTATGDTAASDSDDGTATDIGGGEVRDDRPLADGYTVNDSTGLVEETEGNGTDDDDEGLLGGVIGGFTETAKDGFVTVLKDFITSSALEVLTTLITSLAIILSWVPDVHPNPAVEEIHRLTLLVTFAFTSTAVTVTGLLYQVGPVLGISYRQIRLLIPRIIIGLAFGLVSLPLLQLAVDLANALTVAFAPDMLDASLRQATGTAATGIIALLIQATTVIAVAAVYLIADVYLLFVAAISPLIALAWAMPRTQRYAAAFIGGWWTALAMGPLAILVLHFAFALMDGGATLGQSVANWLYGIAAFVLLLIVPYQLYGASQAMTMQAFRLTRGAERRVRKEYRRRVNSGSPDTGGGAGVSTGLTSGYGAHSGADAVNDTGGGTAMEPNWRQQQIAEQPWNHPAARESYNPETHGVEHRPYRRTDPADADGRFDIPGVNYSNEEPDTEPRGYNPDTTTDEDGGER